ncbi:MAG: hypothetical protein AAGD07_13360 [Planctomycetota bacterium]
MSFIATATTGRNAVAKTRIANKRMGSSQPAATIGYFTTLNEDRTGWTGGLLILNGGGRPLEFQCTLPIRPTRAHEILFGASLRQHLISEVIGPALLTKCRTPISILCCQQPEALRLQASAVASDCHVALVAPAAEEDEGPIDPNMVEGHGEITLNGTSLLVSLGRLDAVESIAPHLADLADVVEPFERIRDAIREAQSQTARAAARTSGCRSQESDDHAEAA